MAKVLNATAGKAMPTVKFATVLKIELRTNLNKILAKNTKQTLKKIEKDTDRNFFMSADEAKNYGLIDTILSERK